MTMMSYIYGLHAPDDETIMYAGKTHHPRKRLVEHIAAARDGVSRPVYDWIRGLLLNGQMPTMVILEDVTSGGETRREAAWIKHLRSQNPLLTNAPHGRLGGRKLLPDQPVIVRWEPNIRP